MFVKHVQEILLKLFIISFFTIFQCVKVILHLHLYHIKRYFVWNLLCIFEPFNGDHRARLDDVTAVCASRIFVQVVSALDHAHRRVAPALLAPDSTAFSTKAEARPAKPFLLTMEGLRHDKLMCSLFPDLSVDVCPVQHRFFIMLIAILASGLDKALIVGLELLLHGTLLGRCCASLTQGAPRCLA